MSETHTTAHARTILSTRAWGVLLIALVFSLVVDLASKHYAFKHVAHMPIVINRDEVMHVQRQIDPRAITELLVAHHEPMVVIPRVLNLTLVLNPGAVFGAGPGQRVFFVTFAIVAMGFAIFMFARWTKPRDYWAHAALGLLVGGGIGNLYDRLVYACVRDFIHPIPKLEWPFGIQLLGTREIWPYVSNMADLFLLIGIAMLLRHLWRRDGHHQRA